MELIVTQEKPHAQNAKVAMLVLSLEYLRKFNAQQLPGYFPIRDTLIASSALLERNAHS